MSVTPLSFRRIRSVWASDHVINDNGDTNYTSAIAGRQSTRKACRSDRDLQDFRVYANIKNVAWSVVMLYILLTTARYSIKTESSKSDKIVVCVYAQPHPLSATVAKMQPCFGYTRGV